MSSTSAGLSPYIEKILYNQSHFPREPIFDYGIAHEAPILKSGQVCRILLYPGAFNPPHNGHSALLHQALNNSGRDANIIAAIILPIDDDRLRLKFSARPGTLMLTKSQRVTLWRGEYGLGPAPSCWVFEYSEADWEKFQKQLIKTTAADGFEVEFICLCGPDYVSVNKNIQERRWDCTNFVVSDVGRSADFTSDATSNLTQLGGYQRWGKVSPDFEALRRRAEEGASWIYSGLYLLGSAFSEGHEQHVPKLVQHLYDAYVQEYEKIRICRLIDKPDISIRFIATPETGIEISSTRIREVLENYSGDQLRQALKDLVPDPDLLIRYNAENKERDFSGSVADCCL